MAKLKKNPGSKAKVTKPAKLNVSPKTIATRPRQIANQKPRFPVVGIGASAGGLEAFMELFRLLPPDTGMAFVLIQHLSPQHLSMLSAIVQKSTQMRVQEVADGMRVLPNHVYVIPPNSILEIFHGELHLRPMLQPHFTSRLIDTFFNSLAHDHRHLAVGIVLSGTGSDGAQGLVDIKAEGGISLVQDPETSKYDGMPKMAIAIDHPDHVLPVAGLATELVSIASNPHVSKILLKDDTKLESNDERILQKIFISIRSSTGTDFSVYKFPTLVRRIKRRMVLNGIESLKHYEAFLQGSPAEIKSLFSDLIINVTRFFRDPEVFENLKKKVFPEILKDRPEGAPIRVWVPGCSTGEEVYSVAMSLLEFFDGAGPKFPIQIYGTDIGEAIIKKARVGLYTEAISDHVSKTRLQRFFVKEADGYRISKSVRDCCVFSVQDITTDPPIHRLDLLSCRNLMIYLGSSVQKKLFGTFFYALNPRGFLLLGTSESVGTAASLFSIVDDKTKIYVKRMTAVPPRRTVPVLAQSEKAVVRLAGYPKVASTSMESGPVELAEKIVLEKFAPAWLLVNELMEIVHFKGRTQNLVTHRSGQPSWNVAKLLREELIPHVRILIHSAQHEAQSARKNDIKIEIGTGFHLIDIEAVPLKPADGERHFLVLFFERVGLAKQEQKSGALKNRELRKLEAELASTQKTLRSFLDDQSSTNEELQSANEEILSANEELQSTNEELETAKEELQSTNEELTTVNEELSNRNAELNRVNDDLANILNNAHVAIVMLTSNLTIRRLTPAAGKLLGLAPGDVGRRISDFNLGFSIELIEEKVKEAVNNVSNVELETRDRTGRYFSLRIRPYKTTDSRIDGAVLTFVDIDETKSKQRMAEATQSYSNAILKTIHDPLVILDRKFRIERVNEAFYRTFKVESKDTIGRSLYDLGNGQWDIPELRKLLEELLPLKSEIHDFTVTHKFDSIGEKTILINARRLEWDEEKEVLILLAMRDVTVS